MANDAAQEYKACLAELKTNNKTQINLLTILADDYKEEAAAIVDTIEAHLYTAPTNQKMVILYVCDSILKNVKGVYCQLFAKKIVTMFLHVFQHGDEKVRSSLYKIRLTWNASHVFIPSKLYQLDLKVNAMDSAWPIANPKTTPAPLPPQSTSTPKVPAPAGAGTKVFVNREFIQGQSNSSARSNQPANTTGRKQLTSSQGSASSTSTSKVVKKEIRGVDPLDKLLPAATTVKTSPPVPPVKRKAEPAPNGSILPKKRPSEGMDLDMRAGRARPVVKDEDLRQKPISKTQTPKNAIVKPTTVAGSHAFVAPPKARSPARNSPVLPPGVPPVVHLPKKMPPLLPAPNVAQAEISASLPVAPVVNQYSQDLPEQAAPSAVIYDGSVKLDIPQNNRIFVDGKCYEVMFIDDTAVIERGGAPHRIYFSGPPRLVIVDGKNNPLKFGETREIDIGGTKHSVKFGAPGRELYIGGHPFKGHFGGPSINAFVNGRRHDIRITGGAPEVKIEPDPAYDLARFLSKMREDKKVEMKQETPKPVSEDPFNFLKRLKESGYLKPLATPQPQQAAPVEKPKIHNRKPYQPPPPPQPILQEPIGNSGTFILVERRPVAPSLKDFNVRLMKIRYNNVVANLLKKRENSCAYCGMRLDSMPKGSKEYKDHTDAHIKKGLKKEDTSNRHRQWYPTADAWLTDRAKIQAVGNEKRKEDVAPEPVMGVESSSQTECAVCLEKFDEYFDHDEDMWRFRDTVEVYGKIVHVNCSNDASIIDFAANYNENIKQEPMEEEEFKPTITKFETKPLIGR